MADNEQALQNDIDNFASMCMYDFEYFAKTCLSIKPKVGPLQNFEFNKAQIYLDKVVNDMIEKYGKVRVIIVKGRQQGLSTWVEARGYWKVCHEPGTKAFILTHEGEATKNLFNMAKRYHDNAPPDIRPVMQKSNQTEMTFNEMDCEYAIGTAKTGDSGRSQTIQFFHGCLAQGTQILTPDGTTKSIEDFKPGDGVITHNKNIAPISFISSQIKECFKIETKFGQIVASDEHKFLVGDKWVTTAELRKNAFTGGVGQPHFITFKGETNFIYSIEYVGHRVVYDFEVNHDDHSYMLPEVATHNSEVAYWRAAKEIASGCMEGIPEEPGTESYLESTAAGFGGYFHSMWQNGIYPGEEPHAKWNGYIRVFVPWIWQPEYRMKVFGEFERTDEEKEIIKLHGLDDEQLQWRRMKIAKMENDTARFQRDYPLTPEEAFNSAQDNVLISANLVIKARAKGQIQYYQPVGSVILGVDVARFGDDSTSFALRQGRVIFWTKRFNKLDSMAVTSEIIMILRQFKIDFVTVDGTGGYGAGVIDRLREMGYGSKVVEVNFSERALEDEKFKNKRSEIWAAVRDWLLAGAQLPNDDAIQHDLCSVTYKFDSAGDKLQLESKAEMKKRGIKSPDIGDAIALTFARPSLGLSGVNGRGESFDPDEYFG